MKIILIYKFYIRDRIDPLMALKITVDSTLMKPRVQKIRHNNNSILELLPTSASIEKDC